MSSRFEDQNAADDEPDDADDFLREIAHDVHEILVMDPRTGASEPQSSMVLMVLTLGRSARLGRYTGLLVGAVLFLYITFEAPLSGMSMNPARTLASALPLGDWTGLWIYFTAPLAGMLLGSEAHVRLARSKRAGCAKLAHSFPCIFCGGEAARST